MRILHFAVAILAVVLFASPASAREKLRPSKGQIVYVPVYSHIYQGPKGRPYNLSAMLSIRNVDASRSITVTSVEYYDDHGELVKTHVSEPIVIAPMATQEYHIPEYHTLGGSGANFLVRWVSDSPMAAPIIQAVMIGTASTQGISFVCNGVVLEEE